MSACVVSLTPDGKPVMGDMPEEQHYWSSNLKDWRGPFPSHEAAVNNIRGRIMPYIHVYVASARPINFFRRSKIAWMNATHAIYVDDVIGVEVYPPF